MAVISDKYLRSPYCMYEIYKIWQKYQGDTADLAQHLVPIMLPDVKIGDIQESLPYLEYWDAQAKSVEALATRVNLLRLNRETFERARAGPGIRPPCGRYPRLFLRDVLMPRKLEAHLENDFQTVRDALRRRLAE